MTLTLFIAGWLLLVILGTPIGMSMVVSSLGYFLYAGTGLGFSVQRIVDGLNSFPVIAVPLFILAANLFNACRASPTTCLVLPVHWWGMCGVAWDTSTSWPACSSPARSGLAC